MESRFPLPPCDACAGKLATPEGRFCLRCGGRRFQRDERQAACSRCRTAKFRFERVIALGEYETELRLLVLRMKTERSGHLATALATLLLRERMQDIRAAAPDWILSVPIHRRRYWERGVNAPDLLAAEFGRSLRIPVSGKTLRRNRATDLQYMLSTRQRTANVEGAFSLARNASKRLSGKRILLVDDILTTGATCNEIAKLLRNEGNVQSVTVCVLARAEGRPHHVS